MQTLEMQYIYAKKDACFLEYLEYFFIFVLIFSSSDVEKWRKVERRKIE